MSWYESNQIISLNLHSIGPMHMGNLNLIIDVVADDGSSSALMVTCWTANHQVVRWSSSWYAPVLEVYVTHAFIVLGSFCPD